MNILKPDSPVMDFLRTVTNLVIVNILYIICSIPIITFGAAYSAKYYVAMKVIRGEGTGVVIPFFKAFKRNFKQATAVWIVMLVAIFLIIFDWRWITYNGWSNTEFVYKFFVIFFSFAVLLMTMAIFPTIARYDMKTSELFKAALIFIIIKFIPLVLIVFTSTTITYFLSIVFIKQFDKLEKAQAEKLKALKESVEYDPETDAAGNISLAGSKKEASKLEKEMEGAEAKASARSGNKLVNYIKTEKEKLKGLTAKQKAVYFMQYYVPSAVLVILVIGAVVWYGHDVYKSKMRVLGGGVINGSASDEGRKYATDGFLSWGGYDKARWASLIDSEDLNFKSDLEYEEKYLEVAFRATLATGAYDYLIMREDAVYNYSTPDNFQDLSQLLDMENFSEDDFYYYVATEEEKEKRSKGISINDLFGAGNKKDLDKPVPLALKLTDDIEKKLGLDEEYDYYIAFAYSFSASGDANYRKYVEYLFGKC